MTTRESFSIHFGSPTQRAEGYLSRPYTVNEQAKAARDARYRELKAEGVKARRSVLNGQLKQYWGWQDPCGIVAPVYELYY